MPVIHSDYLGSKWLRNGHLETIMPALIRKVNTTYLRERITLSDGDFMDLDWIKSHNPNLLLLIHGLEGSSNSTYIKGFANHFSAKGFDVCAMNLRGCSGETNKLLRSYHSGVTEDLEEVLNYIVATHNYQHISSVGFSLGGNLLLKYLGDNGSRAIPIKTAVAFSAPVDLAACAIEMSLQHNTIYMQRFLKSLRNKMQLKAKLFPKHINLNRLNAIRTFYQFDDAFTAPLHGFASAEEYYQKCSSIKVLGNIHVPTLLVNAINDPFLPKQCYPYAEAEKSNYLFLETPIRGGHVGFSFNLPNSLYWSELRAMNFISSNSFH